ncbi:MAG: hypothetical protein ACRDWD_16225 [Acidimicrobiia bacterium]
MSDRESKDSTASPQPPEAPKVPEPPPFDPDPKLVGDMQKSEKKPAKKR